MRVRAARPPNSAPRACAAEAEAIAGATAEAVKVGDPLAEGVMLGPLASVAQRDRVQGYIQMGIEEGATLVAGPLGKPKAAAPTVGVDPVEVEAETPGSSVSATSSVPPSIATGEG
ncbi:MAG: aldehyde dehydrogenase family protein [Ilumatobacteraceae bacterium]